MQAYHLLMVAFRPFRLVRQVAHGAETAPPLSSKFLIPILGDTNIGIRDFPEERAVWVRVFCSPGKLDGATPLRMLRFPLFTVS